MLFLCTGILLMPYGWLYLQWFMEYVYDEKQMATVDVKKESSESAVNRIILPAPTPWPFILAFGISLIFGGMVTSVSVTILGAVLTVAGFVGWFRDVLPHEK